MPIQGTSADMTKLAMIKIDEEFKKRNLDAHLVLTLHDELAAECPKDIVEEVAHIVQDEMEKAGEYFLKKCPIKAEGGPTKYWEH